MRDWIAHTFAWSCWEAMLDSLPMHHAKVVLVVSAVISILDTVFGLPSELLIAIILGLILEVSLGVAVALSPDGEGFRTRKFSRFFLKVTVMFASIAVIHQMKSGFMKIGAMSSWVQSFVDYTFDTFYVFFIIMIALYLLYSIAENGAKLNIPFFRTIAKYLKIRIERTEDRFNE